MTTIQGRTNERALRAEALAWLVDQIRWERTLDHLRDRTLGTTAKLDLRDRVTATRHDRDEEAA